MREGRGRKGEMGGGRKGKGRKNLNGSVFGAKS